MGGVEVELHPFLIVLLVVGDKWPSNNCRFIRGGAPCAVLIRRGSAPRTGMDALEEKNTGNVRIT
jgi:hypothetical protein